MALIFAPLEGPKKALKGRRCLQGRLLVLIRYLMGKRPISTATPEYTLLDHTADLGIEICGSDLKNLFENAGKAMMHLMLRGDTLQESSAMKISLSAEDLPDLMVRWLGEILYLFEGEDLVLTSMQIHSLCASRLEATLQTIPFDPKIHEILMEIKAVTYHQIKVAKKANHWEARIIFDV